MIGNLSLPLICAAALCAQPSFSACSALSKPSSAQARVLADIGLATPEGDWLPNPWGVAGPDALALSEPARSYAVAACRARAWRRLGPARALAGRTAGGLRIEAEGLLAAADLVGPGTVRLIARCGFRPDCVPEPAASALGGPVRAWSIIESLLSKGGGGRMQAAGPALPRGAGSAFLPWTPLASPETPPLQGQRRSLR
ncbi:MAG: hypothetical protein OXI01_07025 [Albidovulum sp.]|nr:hypothetical protein [Albidovulum sp.]